MHRDIPDDKNRMFKVRIDRGQIIGRRLVQSSSYEGGILCADCDNKLLGGYERYGSLILYDGHERTIQPTRYGPGLHAVRFGELDYRQFKLFLLSMLWKASISTLDDYQGVDLEDSEDRVRLMLLDGDPGGPYDFGCVIIAMNHLDEIPSDLVAGPTSVQSENGQVFKFLINGLLYLFFEHEADVPAGLKDAILTEEGELVVIYASPQIARRVSKDLLGIDIP